MAPKVSRDDILIPLADSRLSAVVEMERKQNQFSFHGILKKPTINSDFLPFYMFSSLPQYRSVFYFAVPASILLTLVVPVLFSSYSSIFYYRQVK